MTKSENNQECAAGTVGVIAHLKAQSSSLEWNGYAVCDPRDPNAIPVVAATSTTPADEVSEELDIAQHVVDSMGRTLARIAIAVNGPELPNKRHSYHDLAEKVEKLVLENEIRKVAPPSGAAASWASAVQASAGRFQASGPTATGHTPRRHTTG